MHIYICISIRQSLIAFARRCYFECKLTVMRRGRIRNEVTGKDAMLVNVHISILRLSLQESSSLPFNGPPATSNIYYPSVPSTWLTKKLSLWWYNITSLTNKIKLFDLTTFIKFILSVFKSENWSLSDQMHRNFNRNNICEEWKQKKKLTYEWF